MDLLRVVTPTADRRFRQLGVVSDPGEVVLRSAFNAPGSLEFTSTTTSPSAAALGVEGARIIATGEHGTWSGALEREVGPATDRDVTVRYTVLDDWAALMALQVPINPDEPPAPQSLTSLGQAVPVGPGGPGTIDGQGFYYQWHETRAAESTIKAAIADALSWWGETRYRIAPDLGRGGPPTILPPTRFETLQEACTPILEGAGLGLHVAQHIAADGTPEPWITVDVWEPRRYAQRITPGSEIIQAGQYRRDRRPAANDALVGGPGQDAARIYYRRRDEASVAVHGVVPGYVDATQTVTPWPDDLDKALQVAKYIAYRTEVPAEGRAAAAAALDDAARQLLTDGAISANLAVTLATTVGFFVGERTRDGITERGFLLGDVVPVHAAGIDFDERIRLLTIRQDRTGTRIVPSFGAGSSDAVDVLARSIANLGRALAAVTRSR